MCISFRASREQYRGFNEKLVGTGQVNAISRNTYRDILNIIFKSIKKNNLGIIIQALYSKEKE